MTKTIISNELPATRKPGFATQKAAQAAATFDLGPLARHGFEYETHKCDGRWLWKALDEVKPPTAADLKMSGGKKAERAEGRKSAAKTEQAKHEQRGAERAKAEGRLRPGTSLTALAQAITDGTPGKALDAPEAPEASPAAPATENAPEPSLAAQMGVSFAPERDPLDIPTFLQRPKPTAAETEAVREKLAKMVGPERTIKNPPDAKKAAADPVAPKPAKVPKAARARPAGPGVGEIARDAILRGKSNEDALAAVMKAHPSCSSNLGCMNWYRNKLKKDGLLLKTGEVSEKGRVWLKRF